MTVLIQETQLAADYSVPPIIVGGWQLSAGHRAENIDRQEIFRAYERFVERGLSAFDCADIYTGVEALLGEFLRRTGHRHQVRVHTKFVPDRAALPTLTRQNVESVVNRSLTRLGVDRLDLVQFAWWDYDVPGYLDAAGWLVDLQQAGKIHHLGATNFDVVRMQEMLDAGVRYISNQVQYSVLDRRPEHGMTDLCAARGVAVLTYGTLAGGFLSERYVDAPDPPQPLSNRSLTKYRLIIEECGGWDALQTALRTLSAVARKHRVAVPSVALRFVLDQPQVAATVLGIRNDRYLESTFEALELHLDEEDRVAIVAAVPHNRGPTGDVFGLERVPDGPHAQIMRYDLNSRES